jgi:hypothetical protein
MADRERVSGGGSRHLRCDGGGEKRLKSEHEGRKDPDPALRFAALPHPARFLAAYSNLAAPRKRGATQDMVRPAPLERFAGCRRPIPGGRGECPALPIVTRLTKPELDFG